MNRIGGWLSGILSRGALGVFVLAGFLLCRCAQGPEDLAFVIVESGDGVPGNACAGKDPNLQVIATPDEMRALGLTEQLCTLNYRRSFALVVCRVQIGCANPSFRPEVEQVIRHEQGVHVKVRVPDVVKIAPVEGCEQVISHPYQIVAVSKGGRWGQTMHFALEVDGQESVERDHFIP